VITESLLSAKLNEWELTSFTNSCEGHLATINDIKTGLLSDVVVSDEELIAFLRDFVPHTQQLQFDDDPELYILSCVSSKQKQALARMELEAKSGFNLNHLPSDLSSDEGVPLTYSTKKGNKVT
jgi:hypothetical protein